MFRLLCLAVFFSVCIIADVSVKNLAGPPSEFSQFSLPTPAQNADIQNSATYAVNFSPSELESESETRVLKEKIILTVDSKEQFGFALYSPYSNSITLSLKNPKGRSVKLHGIPTPYPIGDLEVPGMDYNFEDPMPGKYVLTIKTKNLDKDLYNTILKTVVDAYILLWNEAPLSTYTSLNTYSLVTGSQVGLVTRVFNTSFSPSDVKLGMAPAAMRGSIQVAEMSVELPDGAIVNQPMQDDGLNGDEMADDGVFGGLITAVVAGQYIFTASVTGINGDGVEYVRTTQQLVTVVDPTLSLAGVAVGVLDSMNARMNIFVAAKAPLGNKYRAYAEVWGEDAMGNAVSVAWIGGMTFVQENAGINSFSLELDLNWISMTGAQEPLTLKNVIIQDPLTFVPIAEAALIPVKSAGNLASVMSSMHATFIGKDGEITAEMREGRRPAGLTAQLNASATASIVLVHGYCTLANPFAKYASDWTDAQFYFESKKNSPHDTFALQILTWADKFGAFSYVGHSQGGAVGLHIRNYYWSGLDLVTGGRVLQSVGTPYQGSSGAGTAANLIKLFGVLCGANEDLTKDGSVLWLAGITPANRALVNYYTTTYPQGKFFGDYCNLATNLVLSWPNDGVAELVNSQLPGGQNQGNLEGWCHSIDMKYPAQSENRVRNVLMNSLAARIIKN